MSGHVERGRLERNWKPRRFGGLGGTKLSCGWSDGVLYKDQIDAMGAESSKLPAIAAMDIHKRLNYPYKGENTEEALTKWSQGVADGSVEPFYKSEPVPTE